MKKITSQLVIVVGSGYEQIVNFLEQNVDAQIVTTIRNINHKKIKRMWIFSDDEKKATEWAWDMQLCDIPTVVISCATQTRNYIRYDGEAFLWAVPPGRKVHKQRFQQAVLNALQIQHENIETLLADVTRLYPDAQYNNDIL